MDTKVCGIIFFFVSFCHSFKQTIDSFQVFNLCIYFHPKNYYDLLYNYSTVYPDMGLLLQSTVSLTKSLVNHL